MFCKIKTDVYSSLYKTLLSLSKLNKVRFYDKGAATYCELLKDNGINLILKRFEFEDGLSYSAIEVIMNPMRLLNPDDYYQLADIRHSEAIYREFKNVFKPINNEFNKDKRNKLLKFKYGNLDAYKFKRVDFAVNIETEEIENYMKLIKRGNIPNGFHQYIEYDKSSKRSKPPKDSFYLVGKNKARKATVTINCYNKGKQLKNEKLPCDKRAKHTIRFEVQCHYNKTYTITMGEAFKKRGFLHILSEEVSDDILRYYNKKTIGFGEYYTFPKALEIIRSKRMKQKRKEALIEALEIVNEKRGIWKAREAVSDKIEFDKKIKEIHELGVNPVTIPVNWKIEHLPCLFDLIQHE